MEYLNSLGFIFDGDRHDPMIFPSQELENDVHILANQKEDPMISDCSTKHHRFGSSSRGLTIGNHPIEDLFIDNGHSHGMDQKDIYDSSRSHSLPRKSSNLYGFPSTASSEKPGRQLKTTVSQTRHKHWTKDEDEILRSATLASGTTNWSYISKKYFDGSRSANQCRNRWKNVSFERIVVQQNSRRVLSKTRTSN